MPTSAKSEQRERLASQGWPTLGSSWAEYLPMLVLIMLCLLMFEGMWLVAERRWPATAPSTSNSVISEQPCAMRATPHGLISHQSRALKAATLHLMKQGD